MLEVWRNYFNNTKMAIELTGLQPRKRLKYTSGPSIYIDILMCLLLKHADES